MNHQLFNEDNPIVMDFFCSIAIKIVICPLWNLFVAAIFFPRFCVLIVNSLIQNCRPISVSQIINLIKL